MKARSRAPARAAGRFAPVGVLLAALAGVGGRCSDCPPVALPPPMTEARAEELDPTLVEGLGLSTTLVQGDCRLPPGEDEDPRPTACEVEMSSACFEGRSALHVFVLPVNVSLPRREACGGQYAVDDLRIRARAEGVSSAGGEIVFALEPGRYALYVSRDDRCALCGLREARDTCLVDVVRGGITVRDLVLDEATH